MADDQLLASLLERWEAAHEQGTPLTPEDLCQASPHLLTELTRRIGQLLAVEKVLAIEPTFDQKMPRDEGAPEVPGYEIVRRIEVGGMGKVYEARHQLLGTVRAIKVMRSSGVSVDALERFRREMTVGARFEHEHLVPVYEAGLLADGSPYFVMPLIRGGSLKAQLARYQQDVPAAVALMEDVCRAVDYAHTRGIVHRDLKPGNILLTEEGKPLVADFGIAKLLSEQPASPPGPPTVMGGEEETPVEATTGTPLTRTGAIMGTWAYLSPEAVRGHTGEVDARSDVWALGVILYQLLTGQYPFPAKEPLDVATQITGKDPPPPGTDPTLARIVMRCLRKERSGRYPSAWELADDLQAWAAGRPPRGVAPSWGYRLRWQARRSWKAAAGLALLGAFGLALQALFSEGPSEREKVLTAMEAHLAKLRKGQTVTLIGPGVESAHVLTFGNGTTRQGDGLPEGAVAFASEGPAHWELLPEVPTPNEVYRVEAEIAHTAAYPGDFQLGGISLCGSDIPTSAGRQHVFLLCGLAERGSLLAKFARKRGKPSGGAFLSAFFFGEDVANPWQWHPGIPVDRWVALLPSAGPNLFPPRPLAIDVRPDRLSARLSDEMRPFGVLDEKELQSARNMWLTRRPIQFLGAGGEARWFPVQGSLGIVTRYSELTVTRLEVVPLAD